MVSFNSELKKFIQTSVHESLCITEIFVKIFKAQKDLLNIHTILYLVDSNVNEVPLSVDLLPLGRHGLLGLVNKKTNLHMEYSYLCNSEMLVPRIIADNLD